MKARFSYKLFNFKTPSGTSRGILTQKHAWFLHLEENGKMGLGECSIIPGLSPDYTDHAQYETLLQRFVISINEIELSSFGDLNGINLLKLLKANTTIYTEYGSYPSLLFGFEMAVLNWANPNKDLFFDTPFGSGEQKIPINGLVWMGTSEFMAQQMKEKVEAGYNCIKMKVGAIDFDKEMELLTNIRSQYSSEQMILRVDANGAFDSWNVRPRLAQLAEIDIHSIEQPLSPGQHELMAQLCKENLLPIALDEELIGMHKRADKKALLDSILPQYIILKPSLHGGILGTLEWIHLAEERNIDWWMTSALESNVGLSCIAQFTSTFPINKHHGLGTGSLYQNNVPSKLQVDKGMIFMRQA